MKQTRPFVRLALSVPLALLLAVGSPGLAQTVPPPPAVPLAAAPGAAGPEALDQMVAPVALFPDGLVAQVLAASRFPSQVAEAVAWLDGHRGLDPASSARDADAQPWDPGVKALTAFPDVLAELNRNLAWTTALGVDYAQQPQAVLAAVQRMRARAEGAGALRSTEQQTVSAAGGVIAVAPADPAVAYVPAYDPWTVYGAPVPAYPGWVETPGVFAGGPGLAFGAGVGLAAFAAFGWGWRHWGADWRRRSVVFNNRPVFARSVFARPGFGRPGFARPGFVRPGFGRPGFAHGAPGRGFAARGGFPGGGFHGGFHGGGRR